MSTPKAPGAKRQSRVLAALDNPAFFSPDPAAAVPPVPSQSTLVAPIKRPIEPPPELLGTQKRRRTERENVPGSAMDGVTPGGSSLLSCD